MHAKWLLPNYWTFHSAQSPSPLSLCVCVCAALCMQRLPAASCWGLTKAKVPRCQVAVKLLLRARTQNRIEPNGMERNGTPNQIVIIRDGACDIPILLWNYRIEVWKEKQPSSWGRFCTLAGSNLLRSLLYLNLKFKVIMFIMSHIDWFR